MEVYSLPYMGSKTKIAIPLIEKMIELKPQAKVFIDLFGGGGAISLTALTNGRFDKVIYNEYDKEIYDMLLYALYELPKEKDLKSLIVDRETFKKILAKENKTAKDRTILNINSFGNKGTDYLWAKEIEDIKLALSYYILEPSEEKRKEIKEKYGIELSDISHLSDIHKRKINVKNDIKAIKKDDEKLKRIKKDAKNVALFERLGQLQSLERLERLEKLQSLDSLERIERIERLERLERFENYNLSYEEVDLSKYKDDEVIIYCDPPYKGKKTYHYQTQQFDYEKFYKRLKDSPYTIFISEYDMPSEFKVVEKIPKVALLNCNVEKRKINYENLYCNKDIELGGLFNIFDYYKELNND